MNIAWMQLPTGAADIAGAPIHVMRTCRGRKPTILLAALVALSFGNGSLAYADTKPLVTLVSGANQSLFPRSDAYFDVRVPIAVADGKAIDIKKIDVSYKEGRSDSVYGAFKVTAPPASSDQGAAIVVTSQSRLLPGTYVLSLLATVKGDPKTEQSIVLNLTIPTPQVSANAKIVVSQLFTLFGNSGSSDTLVIRETSGKIGALDLTPMAVHDAPAKGDAVSATLKFEPFGTALGAGAQASGTSAPLAPPAPSSGSASSAPLDESAGANLSTAAGSTAHLLAPARFKVQPDGDFPLGTTTGHIDVVSPSLATPLTIPFEVRAHRSELLIVLIAAFGALAGWLLRTWLSDRKSLLEAEAAIAAAARSVARAKEACSDPDFHRAMKDLELKLADALETGVSKTISDAAKEVEDEVKKKRDEIEAQVAEVRASLSLLDDIIGNDWSLPGGMNNDLEELRKHLREAADQVNARNISGAKATAALLRGKAIPSFTDKLIESVAQLSAYLAVVAASPFPASPDATALLSELAKLAASTATEVANATADDKVAGARLVLARTDNFLRHLMPFASQAEDIARALCDKAFQQLRVSLTLDQSKSDAVLDRSVAAAEKFREGVSSPSVASLGWDTDALKKAWATMLASASPTLDKDKLDACLVRSGWLDAVVVAIEGASLAAAHGAEALDAKKLMQFMVTEHSDGGQAAISDVPVPSRAGAPLAITPASTIADLGNARRKYLAHSRIAAGMQSLGVGLVFVVGAYLVYGDAWVGTSKEMLTVFLLAFGMDLTGDGVLAALKKAAG